MLKMKGATKLDHTSNTIQTSHNLLNDSSGIDWKQPIGWLNIPYLLKRFAEVRYFSPDKKYPSTSFMLVFFYCLSNLC